MVCASRFTIESLAWDDSPMDEYKEHLYWNYELIFVPRTDTSIIVIALLVRPHPGGRRIRAWPFGAILRDVPQDRKIPPGLPDPKLNIVAFIYIQIIREPACCIRLENFAKLSLFLYTNFLSNFWKISNLFYKKFTINLDVAFSREFFPLSFEVFNPMVRLREQLLYFTS